MQLSKKLLALSLALIMMVAFSVNGFSATFVDVPDNSPYKEAISSMVSLGLLVGYEDGSFRPNDTITRAEFAAVITRALGMESIAASASSADIFSDMTTNGVNHWATGYVRIAYDKNIILGMGDGTFAPDAPITYEQAVKMIVCTLGREMAANDKGGWPNGYIAEANDIGLTQNAVISPTSSPAPRGLVAQLVFNSLEIQLMERSTGGSMVQVNKTLLKDMLKVTKYNNYMVTEVDGALGTAGNVDEGELLLEFGNQSDVFVYKNIITSDKAKDLIGLYVSGYYKIDSNTEDKILLTIEAASSRNDEVTVLSENIDAVVGLRLEYYLDPDNDIKTKSVKIADDARLIYNGVTFDYTNPLNAGVDQRSAKYWVNNWLSPDSAEFIDGQVRLVDAGSDGIYDALFIEDYETYVIKSPVKTKESVYSQNYVLSDYYDSGKKIQIDPYARENTVNIYNARTGAKMNIESIQTMNVVSVAASKDLKNFTCYVSTNSINGTVDAMSAVDEEYTIGRNKYKLTREFKQAIDAEVAFMDIDSTGTFYLDRNGRIAAATLTAAQSGNYMYILQAGKNDISGTNAAVEVIGLTGTPATPEKIRIATNAQINRQRYSNADDVIDALKRSARLLKSNDVGGSASASQLAKIKIGTGTDGKKEITSIQTAATVDNKGTELAIGTNVNQGSLKLGVEFKELTYAESSGFQNQVFINDQTQVLIVPTNRTDNKGYMRSVGKSAFSNGRQYAIEAYDINGNTAKVIVVYGGAADVEIKSETPASLISSVSEKMSSTGNGRVYSIQVYENGRLIAYETDSASDEYAALRPGDIVRFGFNGNGQINQIEPQVTVSKLQPQVTRVDQQEDGEWKFKSVFGTVSSFIDDRLLVAPEFVAFDAENKPTLNTNNQESFIIADNGIPVYIVNADTRTVTESSIDTAAISEFGVNATSYDADASTVYAYAVSGETKMIVIYVKNKVE